MEEPARWTHQTAQTSERRSGSRGFHARTVTVPLVFILIHFIVVNAVSIAYLLIILALQSASGMLNMLDILSDPEALVGMVQEHYPVITIIYAAFLIPVYALYLKHARRKDERALLTEPLRLMDILPGLAMAVGALGLTNLYFVLLARLAESSPFVASQMDAYEKLSASFSPKNGLGFLIVGISVMAPVTEELLFRGIVQGELRKAMPEPAAVLIQAVIFAAYHLQPIQSSYALIPGLLLGMAYAWSRSIWVPIAMHMFFNFLGSILPVLAGTDEYLGQVAATAQIGFIAAGTLAGVFFYMNRRRGLNRLEETDNIQTGQGA